MLNVPGMTDNRFCQLRRLRYLSIYLSIYLSTEMKSIYNHRVCVEHITKIFFKQPERLPLQTIVFNVKVWVQLLYNTTLRVHILL